MISLRFALYILVCTFASVSFAGTAEKRFLLSVVYNEWSLWNWCSAPCGITGVRYRTRGCHSTLFGLVNFNAKCDTGGEEKENCVGACPHTTTAATLYPGTWSQWTQFSTCDKTCGGGMHIRHRSCTSGTCVGDSIETASCSDHQCPGTWSSWGQFSLCDKTCGGGIQIRHRTCVSGPCIGDSLESASCNDHPCAATMTQLTTTKATTNTKAMTRWATITSTIKATAAWKEFIMQDTSEKRFLLIPDVFLEDWTSWSSCSASCGNTGERHRTRGCHTTFGTIHWTKCRIGGEQKEACVGICPQTTAATTVLLGTWNPWGPFSHCDKTCEGGIQIRHRTCVSGPCIGDSLESAACNVHQCPVQSTHAASTTQPVTTSATTGTQWASVTTTTKATTTHKKFFTLRSNK